MGFKFANLKSHQQRYVSKMAIVGLKLLLTGTDTTYK